MYTTPVAGKDRLLGAALAYARRGIPVFPLYEVDEVGGCACSRKPSCTRTGKHPRYERGSLEHGHNDATTDEEQIRAWWGKWPGANIGTPTGPRSGIWALDVDVDVDVEADSGGFASLGNLAQEHGELPHTTRTRTGGGGMHILFRYPTGEGISNNVGKIATGLDVRGDGGYIVLPPSRTASPYEWVDKAPLSDAPAWLLELVATRTSSRTTLPSEAIPSARARATVAEGENVPVGRRNQTLFKHACSMRARGHDQTRILAELRGINAEYCEQPLEDAELCTIAASAAQYEAGNASAGPCKVALEALLRIETGLMSRQWRGMGELSARDVYVALIWLARKHGRAIPTGVRVQVSERALALQAAVSKRTAQKALKRLRAAGLIRRDGSGCRGLAGAFVLVHPDLGNADLGVEERAKVTHSTRGGREESSGIPLRAPRLRWSAPDIRRLGKTCGAVVDVLEAAGGSATLEEIASTLHRSRPRDLRRRVLPRLLEATVVECDGETYRLAGDWLAALNREREVGGELVAESRDRDRYAREREAYASRWHNRPDPAPGPGDTREFRESYPDRRRRAIEEALRGLFLERPEYRGRRVGQITCALPWYLPSDFPRGPDGGPKDAEVELVLSGNGDTA